MIDDKNKILLVNPTGGWDAKRDDKYFFPIGLLYLQNYLLKHDIPSEIIDVKPRRLSPDDFKRVVREINPKIIGFTGSPFERHTLHEYILGIKRCAPDALVVAGGPYFTATAKDCLINLEDVDVVVRGEGEITLLELVRSFVLNGRYENIKGITYRGEKGCLIENENQRPCDRDECEIDISLIPDDDIYAPFVYLKNFEREKIRALPILLSRGCIKNCTFCFNNTGRFNSRSIPLIIKEIQLKRERFGCDYFWMVDPTFTLREAFARKLCDALIAHAPGIKWYCETRADCSLELLKKMSEAGCVSIDFALESGSSKVLKAIRKDMDLSLIEPFAKECKRLGMRALVFVMYSLPEETYDDFLMTMDILRKIKPYIYDTSCNRTLILPGTQMERQARCMNLLPEDFSWYDPDFKDIPEWKTLMSDEEIIKCGQALRDYQYSLHHSWIGYIRWKAVNLVTAHFRKSKRAAETIRRYPSVHNFLKLARKHISGSQ